MVSSIWFGQCCGILNHTSLLTTFMAFLPSGAVGNLLIFKKSDGHQQLAASDQTHEWLLWFCIVFFFSRGQPHSLENIIDPRQNWQKGKSWCSLFIFYGRLHNFKSNTTSWILCFYTFSRLTKEHLSHQPPVWCCPFPIMDKRTGLREKGSVTAYCDISDPQSGSNLQIKAD